jgi:hypothetical protein
LWLLVSCCGERVDLVPFDEFGGREDEALWVAGELFDELLVELFLKGWVGDGGDVVDPAEPFFVVGLLVGLQELFAECAKGGEFLVCGEVEGVCAVKSGAPLVSVFGDACDTV